MLSFSLTATDGTARTGQLHTAHGEIRTPAFMPVGTAATVKGMLPEQVRASGADILLGNTYHLMLRPGAELVQRLGGLHKFMQWDGPILTDSGGFQVMSLAGLRKMSEEGVSFKSHIDGSRHLLTPERSIEIQHLLGADITMAFDECTPFPASEQQAADSMRLSMRWAQRSREAFVACKQGLPTSPDFHNSEKNPAVMPSEEGTAPLGNPAGKDANGYGIFGIVQGGIYKDLRLESAETLKNMGFDGLAIGGLAVGEGQELMFRVLEDTVPALPASLPRYLMGVGTPSDIIGAVARGIDMFDCVLPTRCGRTAKAFTHQGTLNIRNARHREDPASLDPDCPCPTCTRFSRAYLHHLFRAEEMLGPILLTQHNLHFYQRLMQNIRNAISARRFAAFAREWLARLAG